MLVNAVTVNRFGSDCNWLVIVDTRNDTKTWVAVDAGGNTVRPTVITNNNTR
jgi:hypothetical protein